MREGALSVGSNVLARAVPTAHGLSPRPSVQWVLGSSGSGKSTLLHAWAAQLRNAVLVPPHVVRSVWNDEPEDAVVIIVSNRVDDPQNDAETIPDFWPE